MIAIEVYTSAVRSQAHTFIIIVIIIISGQ